MTSARVDALLAAARGQLPGAVVVDRVVLVCNDASSLAAATLLGFRT